MSLYSNLESDLKLLERKIQMHNRTLKRERFAPLFFFFTLLLLLFISCSPQNSPTGNTSGSTSSPSDQGHLIYTLSDSSLSAFHSTTGTRAWQVNNSDGYQEQPLVTKDTVYAVSDRKLYAFDAMTGQAKWNQPLSQEALTGVSNVVADNQGVYIFLDNIVFAFNVKNGSILWRTQLREPSSSEGMIPNGGFLPPVPLIVIQHGILYTNSDGSFIAALQTSDGKQLWSVTIPDNTDPNSLAAYFQPVYNLFLHNGVLYAMTYTDIVALNIQNGQIIWQTITGSMASTEITDNNMYLTVTQNVVGSPQSGSYQLRLTNGALSPLNLPSGSADFKNGYINSLVYMAGGPTGGDILAVQLPDGITKWHIEGTGQIVFVDVIGSNVYTVRDDGRISLLNGNNGKAIWSQMVPQGQGKNIITDGKEIYMASDGLVISIDIHTGNTLWSAKTNGNFLLGNFPLVFMGSN